MCIAGPDHFFRVGIYETPIDAQYEWSLLSKQLCLYDILVVVLLVLVPVGPTSSSSTS